jgi:GT2 family glycosyltransferase
MPSPALTQPEVSVIVVTYRSAAQIVECLDSVCAQEGPSLEVIVVDNASNDATADTVRNYGRGVRLLANKKNIGFGCGCNQGVAASTGRLIYLLNPDAKLVGKNALLGVTQVMATHPQWGMAGTRILNDHGQSHPSFSYPGQAKVRNDFDRLPGRIAWVLGASMVIHREVYTALNGFDPDFFLYSEETDLCLRLRKLGHEIGYIETVEVRHIGGASEQGQDPHGVWVRKMRGIHLFWRKHYAPEDVERLVRRDQARARLRMHLNHLLSNFSPAGSPSWQKWRRYQAIFETSREDLNRKPGLKFQ